METSPSLVEGDDVVVRAMAGRDDLEQVLGLLEQAEQEVGAPLVDEAEEQRLVRLTQDAGARPAGWASLVAERGEAIVGYGGLVAPDAAGGLAVGDAAVDPGATPPAPVLGALLSALSELAGQEGAGRLEVWVRNAGQDQADLAAGHGFEVQRRLGVLGRSLQDPLPPATESDAAVRAFRPGEDDEAVVEVLAAAYADTPEAGWDLAQLHERQQLPWFEPVDLLLAELPAGERDGGQIAGIHWLKRREPGVGEVYNLAIHPRAQGAGVGVLLLRAGLQHLADVGCHEVILWVDLGNERAVSLYTSQGFETRWQDLALTRTL